MKVKLDFLLKNQKMLLILALLVLTLVIAIIHNISKFLTGDDNTLILQKKIVEQTEVYDSVSLHKSDSLYYLEAINLFSKVNEYKDSNYFDAAKNAFDKFINKFPNSDYSSDAKIKLQELSFLKTVIQKRNSIIQQIENFDHLRQFNNSLTTLSD